MTTFTIFEPARIKSLALKNRIYVTPMVTRFSVPDNRQCVRSRKADTEVINQ